MPHKALKNLEAMQALVVLAFFVAVPFCFGAMPAEVPAAELPEAAHLVVSREDVGGAGAAAVDAAAGAPCPAEARSDGEADCLKAATAGHVALPLLIAIVGGGVFSLEIFDAIPTL
mmetsp:Transcript_66972/g.174287  ORF Transcript_66972/g.174287 Transcript_66972/m.174287 type:complete len:116 (-) Transcript_66972:42-389(-)